MTPSLSRRHVLAAATVSAGVLGAAACSPSQNGGGSGNGSDNGGGDGKTLTFRLWDDSAVAAYEESFKAFTEKSGWNVKIDVVPWANYWEKLPLDISSGDMADVFWMNSASYVQYQQAGNLMNISETLDTDTGQWEQSVVDLYTRDGSLWGVPQLWDSIALFVNTKLTGDADVDPSSLAFDPDADTDSLREAGRRITVDAEGRHPGEDGFDPNSREVFAFNAQADRQAILGPFFANNGADWEVDDQYAFASPEGIAAMGYLADLVNKEHIAPSAADTNDNGDYSRDLFVQGKMALFQSGPYSLLPIYETVGEDFPWEIVPLVSGPAGSKSLVHGVVAVGNANAADDRHEAIAELLTWLGSEEGQRPLGEHGVAFPGNKDAQSSFVDYWKANGVDVEQFITAAQDPSPADTGTRANAGLVAVMPIFQEIMIGRVDPAEGMQRAQDEGNAAMS